MSILKGLKEKVDFLKGFDAEIESKKQGIQKGTKGIVLQDVQKLLAEHKLQMEIESDVKVLEELKKQFLRPDVLADLKTELEEKTKYAYETSKELREACDKAKADYEATLKEVSKKHYELMNEIRDVKNEYVDVAVELGYDWHKMSAELHIPTSSNPAEFVAREKIHI